MITTLSRAVGKNKSAPAGAFLTEMSDAGSFVGRFRSLLLQSADNASAALIPGQTARQRVLKVRPAEADQDPEAVDDNSCLEGTLAGGVLGGALGGALAKKDNWIWSIPAGAVGGALVGCQVDGG